MDKMDFKKLARMIDKIGTLNPDAMTYINTVNYIEGQVKAKQAEAQQLRRKELNRISKEFFRNDYERRFGVSVETMFGAIVGIDNVASEVNRHHREHRVNRF
jgi:hypothetical protein